MSQFDLNTQAQQSQNMHSAEISEVFSSIQGEGPYMGMKQIFVRFGRCNMICTYCDELDKMQKGAYRDVSLEALGKSIDELEMSQGPHHSVSLTGGEPLLYAPFLKNCMSWLKSRGYKTYLETNGTLPKALDQVIGFTDIVAMDMKPMSSTGDKDFMSQHAAFLKIAMKSEVFVKVVVTAQTKASEIEACAKLVSDTNPHIPFILQPMTIGGNQVDTKVVKTIEAELFGLCKMHLQDVRVISQMHKIWGVR